jgi:hypothetical protein
MQAAATYHGARSDASAWWPQQAGMLNAQQGKWAAL